MQKLDGAQHGGTQHEDAQHGGLRERKKRETRDRLVAVALLEFGRSGYASATVESIAAAAGVSTRTFFHYFPTKQDVLLGHEQGLLTDLVADVAGAPADLAPAVAMWDAVERLAKHFDLNHTTLRPLYALILAEPFVHRRSLELQVAWEHALADELASRLHGPGRQERALLIAATSLACLRASARRWATEPNFSTTLARSIRRARRALVTDLEPLSG